ncbi:unnamed protein product [Amaranthus hypochondriacus]
MRSQIIKSMLGLSIAISIMMMMTTTEGRVMGLMAPSSSMTLNGAPTLTNMLTISPTESPAPSPGSADPKPDEESNDDEPDDETLAPDVVSPEAADQDDNGA